MVVDTVEQGQGCIEYLRNQNVGRASFIVLDKIGEMRGMGPVQTPENVPRLFDLIKPKDPRFAPAFYKGVQDTLVANDMEQANRIAFGGQRRWRVVTLGGQLIDTSGTMSGGGNSVSRGGMSSKLQSDVVSPQVLRQYEEESDTAARELNTTLQELQEVEAEVARLLKSGPQLEMSLGKIKLEIQTNERQIAETNKRVKELKYVNLCCLRALVLITADCRAQTKPDASDVARIKRLRQDVDTATATLEQLQEKAEAINADIKALQKKILDIGGSRLMKQKSDVDSLRTQIELANDEITRAEVIKNKAEKDVGKFEATIATNSEALETAKDEFDQLQEQLGECQQFLVELRAKMEEAQAAADNSKEDLESLKSELETKTEEIQEFRRKEVSFFHAGRSRLISSSQMELETKLTDTKREATENERLLTHYQHEHDALKLEDVE
jgi:structural maintenance of chromosome 4